MGLSVTQTTRSDMAVPVMLVVGNMQYWRRDGRDLPDLAGFHFAGFQSLTLELFARIEPDVVLSALLGDSFDAIDLARRLTELSFRGRYRAVANGLPNPDVVRNEVRAAAPGLDFDIFDLGPGGSVRPD